MGENNQKMKMLRIIDYLKTESSPEKPLTTNQIIYYLGLNGITCDRRTLYKDMEQLSETGFDVVKTTIGRKNAYYYDNKQLSLAEIKILIDAVQAANFITDDKTEALVDKLVAQVGMRKQEIVLKNIIFYNNHKHSNESIFENIEQIERAVKQKRQISFYYFDLDENAGRVYRKDKKRYIADPIALVYNEDNYYLVTYNQKYQNNTNYRVDRMDTVEIEETPVCDEAQIKKRKMENYTEQVFKMYNGNAETVTLEFPFELLGAVYDKFGEKAKIQRSDSDKLKIEVTVRISPPFWGWLFQFIGKMKIIEPLSVLDQYNKYIHNALECK